MCKKPSWIELCGLVTAVCAIVVSVYSVYKTIQHDSLEAVPHLSFYSMGPQFIYYPGMRGPFEIGVSNNGSGIAIVQEIKILCNGLEAEEAIRVCAVESGYVVQTNNSVPYYLRSGQKIIFFRANDDAIKAKIEGVPEQKTKK